MPTDRETPYGLRPVLQAVRRIRAEVGRDEQGGAQGRPHHRGRLGRQDLADRGSGHRGFVNGVSVRGRAAVQPVRVRGTHARHGAELVAAGPCGDVRVVRRFHAPPGVRQSEDRRHRASARGRGRVERRVPGFGRALLGRRAARTGQEAEGQALGGEHRMARHDGVGRRDARPPVRLVGRAADRDTRVARGIQFPPVPEA